MQIAPSPSMPASSAGTTQPQGEQVGFPPFKTDTYPAQFFWLAVTFTVLLIVMWRVAVPRIGGSIGMRRDRIDGDLSAAEAHREAAEKAAGEYAAALAQARTKAQGLAEENRQHIQGEVESAKAKAEKEAQAAMHDAESRIADMRDTALSHVRDAARDASMAIVARLIDEEVPADEAAAAVRAAMGR